MMLRLRADLPTLPPQTTVKSCSQSTGTQDAGIGRRFGNGRDRGGDSGRGRAIDRTRVTRDRGVETIDRREHQGIAAQ